MHLAMKHRASLRGMIAAILVAGCGPALAESAYIAQVSSKFSGPTIPVGRLFSRISRLLRFDMGQSPQWLRLNGSMEWSVAGVPGVTRRNIL